MYAQEMYQQEVYQNDVSTGDISPGAGGEAACRGLTGNRGEKVEAGDRKVRGEGGISIYKLIM